MLFNTTDKQLISKALDGSQRAWLKLVKRYESLVYNYCLRMTGNSSDAMDLMQEVFLSIYRNLPSFRGDAQFKTWMMRIASNRTIDFLRQRSSPTHSLFKHSEADDDSSLLPVSPTKHNPDSSYAEDEKNQEVRNYLRLLSAEQRLLVELKFFSHFTFEEISYQTGVPVNTVKSRVYSALKKLRGQLEKKHVV